MTTKNDDVLRDRSTVLPDPKICPTCGCLRFCGVQYQGTAQDWDGVSEWVCEGCETRYGRWTRRELLPGELERRYGGGR